MSSIIGYIVVDRATKAIDWDSDLHESIELAIESMTNPRQMYCKAAKEETEEKTHWARYYMICPVGEEV